MAPTLPRLHLSCCWPGGMQACHDVFLTPLAMLQVFQDALEEAAEFLATGQLPRGFEQGLLPPEEDSVAADGAVGFGDVPGRAKSKPRDGKGVAKKEGAPRELLPSDEVPGLLLTLGSVLVTQAVDGCEIGEGLCSKCHVLRVCNIKESSVPRVLRLRFVGSGSGRCNYWLWCLGP